MTQVQFTHLVPFFLHLHLLVLQPVLHEHEESVVGSEETGSDGEDTGSDGDDTGADVDDTGADGEVTGSDGEDTKAFRNLG